MNAAKRKLAPLRAGRAGQIIARLRRAYPDAECALHHDNPLQLLVATILSAQCTDERVNKVTPALFAQYRTAADFAAAAPGELEDKIRSTGFFRNKAKSIRNCCRVIAKNHAGKVPDTMDELLNLDGCGRKTASVVLGVAFGKVEGIVVDTHVTRLSYRMGLTRHKTPDKIERALMEIVPRQDWIDFSHLLIWHGRKRCTARKPDCIQCEVKDLCPKRGVKR